MSVFFICKAYEVLYLHRWASPLWILAPQTLRGYIFSKPLAIVSVKHFQNFKTLMSAEFFMLKMLELLNCFK